MNSNLLITRLHFNSQPHKEADGVPGKDHSYNSYFNSQPHKEADCLIGTITPDTIVFQLTASQGG